MFMYKLCLVLIFSICYVCSLSLEINAKLIDDVHRPLYHYSPIKGWMNDPNGLVHYDGVYHLFYQYNPTALTAANMHWGHAASTDLVNWTDYGAVLAPDELGTIFSGCAVVDHKNITGLQRSNKYNVIIAIFTQNLVRANGEFPLEQQSLAYSNDNGRTFKMYAGNPIIPNTVIENFRDPKVIQYGNHYIMLLAAGDEIQFFKSENLINWVFLSSFGSSYGNHQGVWECPDLLYFEYRKSPIWILIVSVNPGGPNGGSAMQYFVGKFNGTHFDSFNSPETELWLDYGPDSYAANSWSNTNLTEPLSIGWMSNWAYAGETPATTWRGQMTSVRTFSLKKCLQIICVATQPYRAIEKLHLLTSTVKLENATIKVDKAPVTLIKNAIAFDAHIELNVSSLLKSKSQLSFCFSNTENEKVCVVYDFHKQLYIIDRSKSGNVDFSKNFTKTAFAPRLSIEKNSMKLRLLVDKTSIELFADDGLTVMTAIYFPNNLFHTLDCKVISNEIEDLNLQAVLVKSTIYPIHTL